MGAVVQGNRSHTTHPRGRLTPENFETLPVVSLGATVNGIPITEENRATVYEFYRPGAEILAQYMEKSYTSKGVRAALVAVKHPSLGHRYAVFVEPGFLTAIDDDGVL